jgi:two-component sensor histidine kinase
LRELLHSTAPEKAKPINLTQSHAYSAALLESERALLTRVATGGEIKQVLRDLILLVEGPSHGEMLASVLFISEDGKTLLEGAAPSLPAEYNAAIDGIAIGPKVGSCGTAAFTGKPVYVSDIANDPLWADFRDLALAHGLRACWSQPIRAADGRLLGTFANYYREPKSPTQRDIEVIAMVAQTAAIAIERHLRERELERAEEKRQLLLRELNHRVKNLFALANSLVKMSERSATTPQEMSQSIQGRLSALSRAHDLVQPGFSDNPLTLPEVPLKDVMADILAPYNIADAQARVHVRGDDFTVANEAITSLALVLHELATNAAKYGALSQPGGTLDISWAASDATLELIWQEAGGPRVSEPRHTGFGTTLTRRSVEGQFRGTIDYDWAPSGLTVRISLPIAALKSL